ncbi:MAG: hypothetical protein V7719_08650 [Psychroserpens sp.]|uniref:hypothetical protein n=1 Tax=Psychroserpens sp. TaxID=2020870 RepID=UPI0030015CBE
MTRLLFLIAFSFIFQWNTFSQEKINNYKYIVVPNQYDFQKTQDQYQLNSLTKFLFNKYGYTAYLENDDFPNDLGANNCLALKAITRVIKGGFLVSKIQIDLVDCKNRVVASSQVGKSKEKNRKKAYQETVRAAFITYQFFDYKYNGNAIKTEENTVVEIPEVKEAKEEEEEEEEKVIETINSSEEKVEESVKQELVGIVEAKAEIVTSAADNKYLLYAQPIDNGFQIVDTEPKKVMILLDSGTPNMFIVKGKDAVVYKKDGSWIYAENSGKNLKLSVLNLKF